MNRNGWPCWDASRCRSRSCRSDLAATRAAVEAAAAAAHCPGPALLRQGRDGRPFVTDCGHWILDAALGRIADPGALADRLARIAGVVEHGLFIGLAQTAILAGPEGVRVVGEPPPTKRISMPEDNVDLFVIGAGSGGVRAARIAARHGARVMIAEEYRVGGTCVIRGCVPKKLLVYASRFADEFEDAAGYGWTVPKPTFDWATLIANKDREIARLEAGLYGGARARRGRDRALARGAGGPPYGVPAASGQRIRARHILIATGAAPHMGPPIPGIEHVISSNQAFHLEALPQPRAGAGRRLYRGRVRRHLQRPRRAGDAGLSRREHPARLRRRPARPSARRDGAARHQDRHRPNRRPASTETRGSFRAELSRRRGGRGRQGHVRHRPAPERGRLRARSGRRAARRQRRHRGRRVFANLACRTSMRSATSPTGSISRRSRSGKATPLRTRCSATSRPGSIMPMCRPRYSRSRRSAPSASPRRRPARRSPRSTSTRPCSVP